MLGARKGSSPLSPSIQPNAQLVFDPVTRRAVRYVETVVPTVFLGESTLGLGYPADRYYAHLGSAPSSAYLPIWLTVSSGSPVYQTYDSFIKSPYFRLDGNTIFTSQTPIMHPNGVFGVSASYAPNNTTVSVCKIHFTARFNSNIDYTTYGIGGRMVGGNSLFATATDHFFQVLRNAGTWELGTCDGSSILQTAGGTANGNFNYFRVEWEQNEMRLYVSDTLVVTQTTNLPTQVLLVNMRQLAPDNFDIKDLLIEWAA